MDIRKKLPYTAAQLRILLTCTLAFGAIAGMIVNCNGQFYPSIAEALGVPVGNVTVSSAIMGVVSFLATGRVVKLYTRRDPKRVAAALIILFCTAHMATGLITALWQYYVISAVRGIAYGFLIYNFNSVTIKSWFRERSGLALSIAAILSGLTGIFFNLAIGAMIVRIGWRAAISLSSLIALVVALPGVLLFLEQAPAEEGRTAEGGAAQAAAEDTASGETAQMAVQAAPSFHDRVYLTGLVFCILCIISSAYAQHLKIHALSRGCSQMFSASLISFAMAGNLVSKMVYGAMSDRIGGVKTALCNIAVIITGLVCLCLPFGSFFLAAGAFLVGAANSFPTVIMPQVVSRVYPGRQFSPAYSGYSRFFAVAGTLWMSGVGSLYSLAGSYVPVFFIGILILLTAVALLPLFVGAGKKRPA